MLAAVPVSLREAGNTEMNTQASMMRISLASTIADPKARLMAINQASKAAKAASANMNSVMPTDFPSFGVPWILSGLAALFGRSKLGQQHGAAGQFGHFQRARSEYGAVFGRCKNAHLLPLSIVTHSLALNVTVQSYNGSLDFGLIACRKAIAVAAPSLATTLDKPIKPCLAVT